MSAVMRQLGRNYAYLYGVSARLPIIGWALSGAGTGIALPGSTFYRACSSLRLDIVKGASS